MSLFLSDKEIGLINSINEELINDIIKQSVIIYKVNPEYSVTDDIYGESNDKVFNPGASINALIRILDPEVMTSNQGLNHTRRIEVYIHHKSLSDVNILLNEGDFLYWDHEYFEITKGTNPQYIQGLENYKHQIRIEAVSAGVSQISIIERPK